MKLPRIKFLRRIRLKTKLYMLGGIIILLCGLLYNFDPLSGSTLRDKIGLCDCPAGDNSWIENSPRCKEELEKIKTALSQGAAITDETNRGVGGWWAGNVYTGFLEAIGRIERSETARCDIVNQNTIKNAWCLLADRQVELKCFDFVLMGRSGKHMWTGLVKKGAYPKPKEGMGLAAQGASCSKLPILYHDIWFGLEPSSQPVTSKLPRSYCSLDIVTLADSYLKQYCTAARKRYRTQPTAGSLRKYEDIFSAFASEG